MLNRDAQNMLIQEHIHLSNQSISESTVIPLIGILVFLYTIRVQFLLTVCY